MELSDSLHSILNLILLIQGRSSFKASIKSQSCTPPHSLIQGKQSPIDTQSYPPHSRREGHPTSQVHQQDIQVFYLYLSDSGLLLAEDGDQGIYMTETTLRDIGSHCPGKLPPLYVKFIQAIVVENCFPRKVLVTVLVALGHYGR